MNGTVDRGFVERWVRGNWGDPGPGLRAAAAVYGVATDARNLLWSSGIFRPIRIGAPVVSIGGLSTGGSGKTPLAAAIARHVADRGARVAVVTAGQADELRLHGELNPDVAVSGGRWRIPLAQRAVEAGAGLVVLDSGFQHRRLHRDLEIVSCNADQATNRDRLPAGPYRERFAALRRADAVIVMRRAAPAEQAAELAQEIAGIAPHVHLASVRIRARGLRAANPAARATEIPTPAVAVAGVMWPESFFRWLSERGMEPAHRFALRDHARYDAESVAAIASAAEDAGIVCTRKDAVRLVPLISGDVPVWWLEEEIAWERGSERLLAGVRRVAGCSS